MIRQIKTKLYNKEHGGSDDYEEYYLLGYDATCFQAGILLSLFFDPEDGDNMFL
jgi:hypothetical protein